MRAEKRKRRRLFAADTGTYAARLRITAAFLSLIMLCYAVPAELVRAAAEAAEAAQAEPRLIEPYDDPPVSHTAGTGLPEEAEPVGEDAAARTATSKRYRLSDGGVMVREYGYPVHYADETTGFYEEIDNRLVRTAVPAADGGFYRNAAGYYNVAIADRMTAGAHLFLEKDGYGLALSGATSGGAAAGGSSAQAVVGVIGGTVTAPESGAAEDIGPQTAAEPAEAAETVATDAAETAEKAEAAEADVAAGADPAADEELPPASADEAADGAETAAERPATDALTGAEKPVQAETVSAAEKLHAALRYESVFSGTDFSYEVTPTGVRERIEIESLRDSYEFTFTLHTAGLEAFVRGDAVDFCDGDGTAVFRLAAPYMTDAAGAYSEAVTYDLSGTNGQYTLTVTASAAWINAPERVLPVSVQPMFQTWTGNTAEGWTLHHDGTRSAPSGGRVTVSKDSDAVVRMPVTTTVPGMMLTRGEVSLHADGTDFDISRLSYEIYAASTEADFADVTSIYDLDIEPTYLWAAETGSMADRWNSFFFSGSAVQNDELLLVYRATNNSDTEVHVSVSASNYLPELTLYYKHIQGVTDFPTETFETGDAAAYVNMVSRKSAAVVKGLSVNTDYQPLQVDLVYNQGYDTFLSTLGVSGYYGSHFKTTYDQYVYGDGTIYYHVGADGSVNVYRWDTATNRICLSEQTDKSISINGAQAILFDDLGNETEFFNGRLTAIRSENPFLGEIRVAYQENTDKIDAVQFYRYGSQVPNNEIRYVYSSAGRLSDLKSYYRDADGVMQLMGQKSFAYDNSGNLTAVKNSAGSTRLTLGYSSGKLISVRSSTGAGYSLLYSNDLVY